jgi:exodeoxyribonuclease V gamma subunit
LLYVERSNRTENLLEGLAARLASHRPDPLSTSVVVVQGQGMERWIAQSIARDYGVCANTEFLFPRNLVEGIFLHAEKHVESGTDSSFATPAANLGWEIDRLIWAVARRIAANASAPELAPLSRQLESSDREWRLVQLSQRIASRFDDYITYRPDWVARWSLPTSRRSATSLGPDEDWQAWLFRGVLEDLGPGHLADRAAHFLDLVGGKGNSALTSAFQIAFPNGIDVFAVSTLPPLYLSVLDGLAQLVDVRLSVLSPSRHYWADLWSEVREAEDVDLPLFRATGANRSSEESRSMSESISPANSVATNSVAGLLSGLGRLGSDFQSALEQVSGYVEPEPDRFEDSSTIDPNGVSLLRRIQIRMLDLDGGDLPEGVGSVCVEDRSLQIHLCHGPKRELEVVEAALRDAFDRDPTLTPEDVIVMAPQIDALVPTIDAVFGGGGSGDEAASIPYRIADRSTLNRSPVAEAFVALLRLLTGRAGRSEVLDWLSLEPARAQLGLDADGVERLGEWASRAGIRFGLDESHREELGLEGSRRHTWAGGIDRLVLGHAMGPTADIVGTLSPEPLDSFSDASLLGAIGELEDTLSGARRDLTRARSVTEWSAWFADLLVASLDHRDDNAHEHGLLHATLQRLAGAAQGVGFDHPIPFEAMRERFEGAVAASPPAQAFLAGGVTFCELVPLRAIPFRLIAIVGLSDTNFPRRNPAASYDLIARHPRVGDRSSRSDDRYLFLEALLSARDELVLTVPSRDLRDGSELPPSVVVSELLDVVESSFALGGTDRDRSLREFLVVDHPIHSFSPRYFETGGDTRLIGLDSEAFRGAKTRRETLESGGERRRFLEALEPNAKATASPGEAHLGLDELTRRILRSTRTFLRERLRLRLPRPERAIDDFDPVDIDALDQFGLGGALLAERRAGASDEDIARRLAASARLPEGEPGRLAARFLRREVDTVFGIASSRFDAGPLTEYPFDMTLEGVPSIDSARLSGVIRDVSAAGPIRLEFSRFGGRSELEFWVQHLVVCALVDDEADLVAQSVVVSRTESKDTRERVAVFSHVPDAKAELALLFEWAWSVDRAPLPFFPRTSRIFAEHRANGRDERAWNDAHQKFYGGDSGFGARPEFEEELEYARAWEGSHPLEPDLEQTMLFRFDSLADRFFASFRKAREVYER